VLNLGIEGIMTAGAMVGWLAVHQARTCGSAWRQQALVGAAFGLLHATLTVPLALSQHVSGLGVTLLATSLSHFAYRTLLPNVTAPPRIEPFAPLAGAGSPLADLPVLGPLLSSRRR
jgi:simple sugar transport system permease protein